MQRGKLRWRCRRGMRELDELLLRFLEQQYDGVSAQEKTAFSRLLELQDPQLWAYLTGREIPPDPITHDLIHKISRTHPLNS